MKYTSHEITVTIVFFILSSTLLFNIIYLTYYNPFNYAKIELVVSRYNENLEWLRNNPYNKYDVVVYNKGQNENFEKASNIKKIIKLKNVGRESHTYLYHIIENYYNLADVTVFLPGSADNHQKMDKTRTIVEAVELHKDTVFVGRTTSDIKSSEYGTSIDGWESTNVSNNEVDIENNVKPSNIRPFGKWIEEHFPNVISTTTSGFCIIAIAKHDIVQHPIEYYKKLIKEVETSSHPETGHYFERAWFAVFYPYKNLKHVNYHW